MRVLVVAEYYPRAAQPVLGVWAHRQALAARDAGAEVRVLVLHRPLPSLQALRRGEVGGAWVGVGQSRRATLDGLTVDYLRYLSPPRPLSYGRWGAWAAPFLRRALPAIRRAFPFDLIHAHYAVPAGDTVRRAAPEVPLVISVHGGDVQGDQAAGPFVGPTLAHARVALANSEGTARRCRALGAGDVRVVHLGTDLPAVASPPPVAPTLVTVGNLVERKRHADVIAALPALARRHPELRYVIVGDGPQREHLRAQAAGLGVAAHIEFRGALEHEAAVAVARDASVFVLPSVAEAFGVAYVEAMAAGVPAVGCLGEDGPEELVAAGGGIALVPPHDPAALTATLGGLLSHPAERAALGATARETVARSFTWKRCGTETAAVYASVLDAAG
jgi:glycosyltransferase involved in cell wall biosynthesis